MNQYFVYPRPFASFRAALAWRREHQPTRAMTVHYWNFGRLIRLQFLDNERESK